MVFFPFSLPSSLPREVFDTGVYFVFYDFFLFRSSFALVESWRIEGCFVAHAPHSFFSALIVRFHSVCLRARALCSCIRYPCIIAVCVQTRFDALYPPTGDFVNAQPLSLCIALYTLSYRLHYALFPLELRITPRPFTTSSLRHFMNVKHRVKTKKFFRSWFLMENH